MVETSEQFRPLAPASERTPSSDDEAAAAATFTNNRRRRWLRCCSCVGAVLLIQAVVVVILIFTVFKVRNPEIRVNGFTIDRLDLLNGTTTPRPGTNISVTADVSVKNPNYASFRYRQNTTTALFYRGAEIGEARGPPGKAGARRTTRMNVTVDLITDRILAQPGIGSDMSAGLLAISSYTEVGGKAKIWILKKHVRVRMNCTVTVNVTAQAITNMKCKRKVKL